MTDDKTRQLENRIDKLESTIEKMMPSRRDALKMGGAALVGGAAMSGTASAGTNQVGTIGSQSSPVDLESEDINNADTVTTDTLETTTANVSGTLTTLDIDVAQNVNGADTSTAASGEALTSDGTGGLAFASVGGGIPADFTYVDVTSSRSFGTTFTNSTGKALYVTCRGRAGDSDASKKLEAIVDGVSIVKNNPFLNSGSFDAFSVFNIEFFVPNGSTYLVSEFNVGSVDKWFEAEM